MVSPYREKNNKIQRGAETCPESLEQSRKTEAGLKPGLQPTHPTAKSYRDPNQEWPFGEAWLVPTPSLCEANSAITADFHRVGIWLMTDGKSGEEEEV